MKLIIIDYRMREEEKKFLSKLGKIIEINPKANVYEEISGHPDIFICKINDKVILSPNLREDNYINIENCEYGKEYVEKKYPNDIKYNICQIGNNVVHDFRYTDERILEIVDKYNLNKIQVKQGYSNCSISVINKNACITSDKRNL